jgi:hypothetical protein
MITEELTLSLSSVINVSPEQALTLLQNFGTGDYNFFKSYYDLLPEASFEAKSSAAVKLSVENNAVGRGASGVVKLNKMEPVVYKQIRNLYKKKTEQIEFLKSIFLEVIIQTVLQNDKSYGKNVCKIYKLYKYEQGCILKLEALECTLFTRLEADAELIKDINKNSIFVSELLLKLHEIFDYFKRTYGFQHKDCHPENIMTVVKGDIISNLKLIDFESSYVKFEGLEFGISDGYILSDIDPTIDYLYGDWEGKKRISEKLMAIIKSYFQDGNNVETLINKLRSGDVVNAAAAGGTKRKTRRRRFRPK